MRFRKTAGLGLPAVTGSKRVLFTDESDATNGWDQYTGTLTVRVTVTGDRTGRIVISSKGATGGAKVSTTYTGPDVKGPSWSVRSHLAEGFYDGPLVRNAAFTCAGDTLRLFYKRRGNGWTTVADLRFTRI